jgi:hypothetical protein
VHRLKKARQLPSFLSLDTTKVIYINVQIGKHRTNDYEMQGKNKMADCFSYSAIIVAYRGSLKLDTLTFMQMLAAYRSSAR